MSIKKMLLCAIVALGLCANASAQIKCEVSPCFELTSIVFRLAGAEEYVANDLEKYTSDVDKYFAPHKTHPLIAYCQKVRAEQGIGYDAVAAAGSFIEISDGKVKSLSSAKQPISKLQSRWTEESFAKFVDLLDDFYKQSNFNKFFLDHDQIYKLAETRYDSILHRADVDWFPAFFGGDSIKLHVVLSLCNGPNNYGFTDVNGTIGSVIGTNSDQNGDPYYNSYTLLLFVHETLHGYVNPMVDRHWSKMVGAALRMFPFVENRMRQIAYGNAKTVVVEWLVRLFTLSYTKDHPSISQNYTVEDLVFEEQQQGFVWMDLSMALMEQFNTARDEYQTIEDFVTPLIMHINSTCDNYLSIAENYQNSGPSVINFSPGFGEKIFAITDKVVFTFSEPMLPKYSLQRSPKIVAGDPYWKDAITFVVPVNCKDVAENEQVKIVLYPQAFVSEKGARLRQQVPYVFTIDKQ